MSTDQHLKVLSILYIAGSALFLLGAAIVFVVFVVGGLFSGEVAPALASSLFGTVLSGFLVALAIPGIIGGVGLLYNREWARILILILGFLNLPGFPLGTALGVYTIWALMRDEATEHFRSTATA